MNDEAALRAGIDERVRAVRTKDAERLLATYARDVVTFDLVEPLSNQGIEAVRKRVVAWFASFATPIDYAIRDARFAIDGDVAFDSHFTHVRGTSTSGGVVDMWFRETVGYRKIEGAWRIVHQHSSVPMEMPGMKGRLDLQP